MKLTDLETKILQSGLGNPTLIAWRLADKLKIPVEDAVREVAFYYESLIEEIENDEKLCPIQRYILEDIASCQRFSSYARARIGREFLGTPMTNARGLFITRTQKALNEKIMSHIKSPQFQRLSYGT